MKIVTIVGARPQFVKAAMVSRAILEYNKNNERLIEELLLHTGQHYDANMSDIFFNSMSIPQPVWQLQCGNGTHGEMTGRMLIEIEKILLDTRPDSYYPFPVICILCPVNCTKPELPAVEIQLMHDLGRTVCQFTKNQCGIIHYIPDMMDSLLYPFICQMFDGGESRTT